MAVTVADQLVAERLAAERVTTTGTVKWFSDAAGYGIIAPDEGDEDLVFAAAAAEAEAPACGTRVAFEVHTGQRGLAAFGVVPV